MNPWLRELVRTLAAVAVESVGRAQGGKLTSGEHEETTLKSLTLFPIFGQFRTGLS
jgi:hypothetical protein